MFTQIIVNICDIHNNLRYENNKAKCQNVALGNNEQRIVLLLFITSHITDTTGFTT